MEEINPLVTENFKFEHPNVKNKDVWRFGE